MSGLTTRPQTPHRRQGTVAGSASSLAKLGVRFHAQGGPSRGPLHAGVLPLGGFHDHPTSPCTQYLRPSAPPGQPFGARVAAGSGLVGAVRHRCRDWPRMPVRPRWPGGGIAIVHIELTPGIAVEHPSGELVDPPRACREECRRTTSGCKIKPRGPRSLRRPGWGPLKGMMDQCRSACRLLVNPRLHAPLAESILCDDASEVEPLGRGGRSRFTPRIARQHPHDLELVGRGLGPQVITGRPRCEQRR